MKLRIKGVFDSIVIINLWLYVLYVIIRDIYEFNITQTAQMHLVKHFLLGIFCFMIYTIYPYLFKFNKYLYPIAK